VRTSGPMSHDIDLSALSGLPRSLWWRAHSLCQLWGRPNLSGVLPFGEGPGEGLEGAVRAGGAPAGPAGGGAQAERVIVMVPSQVWE
jgi:hypothetical protein